METKTKKKWREKKCIETIMCQVHKQIQKLCLYDWRWETTRPKWKRITGEEWKKANQKKKKKKEKISIKSAF